MIKPLQQTPPFVYAIFAVLSVISLLMGVLINKIDLFMAFGVVGGVIIFISSFTNVQFAVYTLIFATLLSPEFGSRSTSGSGVTVRIDDLLLILICFSQLTKSAIYQRIGLFSWTPLNRYISFYMLVCVLSTGTGILYGNVKPLTGFFFVLKYFQYFVIYFMVINNLDSKNQAKGYLVAILATALIVSVVAIAQVPGGGRVSAPFEGEGGEPNTLGGYLLLISALVCGLLLTPKAVERFVFRTMLIGLLFLMFVVILFTLSRATWLAAIPVLIAFWIMSNQKIILTAMGISVLAIAPFVMPDAVTERLFYTVEKQQDQFALAQQEQIGGVTFDTSSSARIKSWKQAFEAVPTHPILGWGVTGWRFIDAQYLKVIVETGIVGLFAFLLMLYHILKNSWQAYKSGNDPLFQGVALGLFVGTLAMMAHATMTNTFIIVRIMEPFCLLLAIVIGVPHLEEVEKNQTDSASPNPHMSHRYSAGLKIQQGTIG